jgi:hypothetical protein
MYARRNRRPPRSVRGSIVAPFVIGIVIVVAFLPVLVNSVAFLTGSERRDTFTPASYRQRCATGVCHTVTEGYLASTGAYVTWQQKVPLGQPVTVRKPLWGWGFGRDPISGDGTALGFVAGGVVLYLIAFLLLRTAVTTAWRRLRPDDGA